MKLKKKINPSDCPIPDIPDTSFSMVNKYGTYEIQPTNGMQDEFPQIGQQTKI